MRVGMRLFQLSGNSTAVSETMAGRMVCSILSVKVKKANNVLVLTSSMILW